MHIKFAKGIDDCDRIDILRTIAYERSCIPAPDLTKEDMGAIRRQLNTLGAEWRTLSVGKVLEIGWP